jgi:alkyl hydroperoxide reductase subunit F
MVVGGGNSGVEAALELSKIASEVYLVEIMNHLLADEILVDKLKGAPNVKVLLETKVTKIQGDQFVNEVNLVNVQTEKTEKVEIDGIFIELGLIPNTEFQPGFELEKNPWNEIVVNNKCETNIEGLFAAGDVTNVPEKQVIISAGEGAKAALTAFKYLQHQ